MREDQLHRIFAQEAETEVLKGRIDHSDSEILSLIDELKMKKQKEEDFLNQVKKESSELSMLYVVEHLSSERRVSQDLSKRSRSRS
jgi:hypothetical protein